MWSRSRSSSSGTITQAKDGGDWTPVGRVLGIALVSLGVACWPRGEQGGAGSRASGAFRAMLTYNAGVALYLTYLGAFAHVWGVMLWPAVALHAAAASALIFARSVPRN